ncbi:MAG TPA: hypothetical protein VFO19_10320, partial [Vicinamibacterales bacterium]|nr:hypothetical protein [Vicinamibacterales bacterium]
YERLAAGAANVRVVPLTVPAVALISAARVVATINSTVAIEAMALDVPALAMRLPNYLSPFVDAGAMAGATRPADVAAALDALVHDEPARTRLATARRRFIDEFAMQSDGRASERAADAVLTLGMLASDAIGRTPARSGP